MQDMDIKKKVLEEIMGLMDEKEGDKLKSHPKFMAAKIEVEKPEAEIKEIEPGVEVEPSEEVEEEITPEMIDMLLKKYKDEI